MSHNHHLTDPTMCETGCGNDLRPTEIRICAPCEAQLKQDERWEEAGDIPEPQLITTKIRTREGALWDTPSTRNRLRGNDAND
jgi:hypothetical protein